MAHVHDEQRLTDYCRTLAEARLRREQLVNEVRVEIGGLEERLLALEESLETERTTLRQLEATRPGASRRVWLQWEPAPTGRPLGPVGPTWFVASDSSPPQRVRRPTRRLVGRVFRLECQESVAAIVDTVMDLREQREQARASLGRVFHIFKDGLGDVPQFADIGGRWLWAPERITEALHARAVGVARLQAGIRFALEQVVTLEWELDQMMIAFNEQGRRRNNSLSVSWRPTTTANSIAALRGPFFFQLRVGRRSGRHLHQVRAGEVNRDLVRECFQGRFEEELVPLARRIEMTASKRKDWVERLVLAQKVLGLHNMKSNEQQGDHE